MRRRFPNWIDYEDTLSLSAHVTLRKYALRFLTGGPGVYSKIKPFYRFGAGMTPEVFKILMSGCEQIRNKKGLSMEQPFEGLGIGGLFMLMKMFYFHQIEQEIFQFEEGFNIDRITFESGLDGTMIDLFNKVIVRSPQIGCIQTS